MLGRIIYVTAAVALLGISVSECSAQLVKGVVKELDVDVGTITIFVGGKGADAKIGKGKIFSGVNLDAKPQVLNLKAPNIPVLSANGRKATLTDLKPGVPVTLQVSADEDVEAIVAGATARTGTLIALDRDKKRVQLDGGKKGEDGTWPFAEDVAVTVYGHKKSLGELHAGQHVLLVMSLDQKSAVSIIAGLKRTADDPHGTLVAIDPVRHTITLLVGKDGNFRFVTWPVATDFHFVFNEVERPGLKLTDLPLARTLADLPRAAPMWLRLGPDQKSAESLVVEPPPVPAVIDAIDTTKRTLVARLSDGKPETFLIEQDADIRIGGKRIDLQSLNVGMSAQLTLSFEPGRLIGVRAKKE